MLDVSAGADFEIKRIVLEKSTQNVALGALVSVRAKPTTRTRTYKI